MAGLWMSGMSRGEDFLEAREARASELAKDLDLRSRVKELDDKVGRLALLNQALWELLKTRLQCTDQDLENLAREIDLRDGMEDGKISAIAVTCPSCRRINNSRHAKCLYCGQLFEKPVFG